MITMHRIIILVFVHYYNHLMLRCFGVCMDCPLYALCIILFQLIVVGQVCWDSYQWKTLSGAS